MLHNIMSIKHHYLGGGRGGLRCCDVGLFLVRCCGEWGWKIAVLRWSQTLRCAVFTLFYVRCTVKRNFFCGVAILRSNKNVLSRSSWKTSVTVFRRIFLRCCGVDIDFCAVLRCTTSPMLVQRFRFRFRFQSVYVFRNRGRLYKGWIALSSG